MLGFARFGSLRLAPAGAVTVLGTDNHRCLRCLFYLGGQCCHALAPEPQTCTYFKTAISGATDDGSPDAADDGQPA